MSSTKFLMKSGAGLEGLPEGCHPCGVIGSAITTGGVARSSLDHRLSSFDAFGIAAAVALIESGGGGAD